MERLRVGGAAVRLDPGGDRFLGGPTDRDHEADVAVDDGLVEDPIAVLDDRRPRILGERAQVLGVLAEDRVHERVQEQVRAIETDEAQQVLHPRSGAAGERAVRERLVLGAFLADHHDLGGAVEPAPEEHRAVVPAERLAADHGLAEPAVVRGLGEQLGPATRARPARGRAPRGCLGRRPWVPSLPRPRAEVIQTRWYAGVQPTFVVLDGSGSAGRGGWWTLDVSRSSRRGVAGDRTGAYGRGDAWPPGVRRTATSLSPGRSATLRAARRAPRRDSMPRTRPVACAAQPGPPRSTSDRQPGYLHEARGFASPPRDGFASSAGRHPRRVLTDGNRVRVRLPSPREAKSGHSGVVPMALV